MIDLSIIIPAYNEAERIVPTIMAVHELLSTLPISFEIIVVDDGSVDGTTSVVSTMRQQIAELHILILPQNMGKAVRHGMLAATGSIRLFTDADGSTPIGELDKLLLPLRDGYADIVIGSRYLEDSEVVRAQSKMRVVWSRMVNGLVQKMLLPGIVDPHCGFKAFSADAAREVFARCAIDGWSFDLEVLAVARQLRLRIAEVPVKWANDERSKAKLSHLPRELYNFYQIKKSVAKIAAML